MHRLRAELKAAHLASRFQPACVHGCALSPHRLPVCVFPHSLSVSYDFLQITIFCYLFCLKLSANEARAESIMNAVYEDGSCVVGIYMFHEGVHDEIQSFFTSFNHSTRLQCKNVYSQVRTCRQCKLHFIGVEVVYKSMAVSYNGLPVFCLSHCLVCVSVSHIQTHVPLCFFLFVILSASLFMHHHIKCP